MNRNGTVGMFKPPGVVRALSPTVAVRHLLSLGKVTRDRGIKALITRFLPILAACLSAVFVFSIVLEAFDSDLDLWPFGAEHFTVSSPEQPVPTGQLAGIFPVLSASFFVVITAGRHLVLRHRARSALATDSPFLPIALNVAEPWGRNWMAPRCPAIFFW